VVIYRWVERVRPQREARFRDAADESPDREMWLTTKAQLRRPALMRVRMTCGKPGTQAGVFGNDAGQEAAR
jgi:hypothetical protein